MQLVRRIANAASSLIRGRSSASSVARSVAIRVALLALNFSTGLIVARSLGPDGRGAQAAIALWPPFLSTLATFGIPSALNYHSRRRAADAARLYMSSVVAMTLIGLFAAAVGAASIPLLLHGYDQATIREAQWFMIFAPETLVTYAARAHLESRNEFTRSTLILFYPNVLTLAGLCAFRVSGHLTPLTAALSYTVPTALQGIYLMARLWKPRLFSLKKIVSDIKILLPYGLSCYGNDIVNSLAGQIDLVVIVAFLSPADLGLYTVALSLSRQLNIVYASLAAILFSRASSLEPDEAIELAGRAARLSTAFCLGLGMIFLALIPFALPLLYGPTFVPALKIIPILTGEAIVSGTSTVLFAGFMAAGRPTYVTAIQVCWVATAILLLFLLVPRMDLAGAATALLVAAMVRLGLVFLTYPLVLRRAIPGLVMTASDVEYIRNRLEMSQLSRKPIG